MRLKKWFGILTRRLFLTVFNFAFRALHLNLKILVINHGLSFSRVLKYRQLFCNFIGWKTSLQDIFCSFHQKGAFWFHRLPSFHHINYINEVTLDTVRQIPFSYCIYFFIEILFIFLFFSLIVLSIFRFEKSCSFQRKFVLCTEEYGLIN